jgi:hypothetical protein
MHNPQGTGFPEGINDYFANSLSNSRNERALQICTGKQRPGLAHRALPAYPNDRLGQNDNIWASCPSSGTA